MAKTRTKKTSTKKAPRASRPEAPSTETKSEPAPDEPTRSKGPRTKHTGRYRVLSQIRFMSNGVARTQMPYTIEPGNPDKGIKPKRIDVYLRCPSEISAKQVADFFKKGCLEPAFE